MRRGWKAAFVFVVVLLAVCIGAGCTEKDTGPKFETAYIFSEYGKIVEKTECLVDGDPAAQSLARIEIRGGSLRDDDAVYTDLVQAMGLGLPAFESPDGNCIVYTVDKQPVIWVYDWDSVYYVVPAESEKDAAGILENFMRAYAESMGIDEE